MADEALRPDPPPDRRVVLGRVAGPHGVQGWLRVRTFSDARETLLGFQHWMLRGGAGLQGGGAGHKGGAGHEDGVGDEDEAGWSGYRLQEGRAYADGLLVRLHGVADRDAAARLRGSEVAIWRSQLPPLEDGEYYWTDLEGLRVFTGDGVCLGTVQRLFETGANDVMVVQGERERLIPFVMDEVVRRIDLEGGRIEVDWDAEF